MSLATYRGSRTFSKALKRDSSFHPILVATHSHSMLTELEIIEATKRRNRILVPATVIGIVALFAFLSLIAALRDWLLTSAQSIAGETFASFAMMLAILPGLALFLLPMLLAERAVAKFAVHCPLCRADITRFVGYALSTCCCRQCGEQIIEGREPKTEAQYRETAQKKQRTFLAYWLWVWPLLCGLFLLVDYVAREQAIKKSISFDASRLGELSWLPGLIGAALAGWSFARTFDSRYAYPLLLSLSLLVVALYGSA